MFHCQFWTVAAWSCTIMNIAVYYYATGAVHLAVELYNTT